MMSRTLRSLALAFRNSSILLGEARLNHFRSVTVSLLAQQHSHHPLPINVRDAPTTRIKYVRIRAASLLQRVRQDGEGTSLAVPDRPCQGEYGAAVPRQPL